MPVLRYWTGSAWADLTSGGGSVTWPLYAPDGSASAPQYAFTNSQTTGIFRDGSDAIGFSTGGFSRWRIDGSGHFVAPADNTYDIGQSGATRPRDLFLGRNLNVAGQSTLTGNVGIAATPQAQWNLYMNGGAHYGNICVVDNAFGYSNATEYMFIASGRTSGGANQAAFMARVEVPSTASTWAQAIETQMGTQSGSFTIPWLIGMRVNTPTRGGTTTITNTAGVYLNNMGATGVTNAYGVYINAPTGASGSNIGLYNLGSTRLDGLVGLGIAPTSTISLYVSGALTTGVGQYGIFSQPTISSSGTSEGEAIRARVTTAAAAFTLSAGRTIHVVAPSLGAGSAVTTMQGLFIENLGGAGISQAQGIFVSTQSGAATQNYGIYIQGGAPALNIANGGILVAGAAPTNAGQLGIGYQTATTATAGSSGAPPAQVAGYFIFANGVTLVKVPFYNT